MKCIIPDNKSSNSSNGKVIHTPRVDYTNCDVCGSDNLGMTQLHEQEFRPASKTNNLVEAVVCQNCGNVLAYKMIK